MKTKVNVLFILFCLFMFFSACERTNCTNTNPVFDKFRPDDKEYKAELIKQLETTDKSKLRYWFKEYVVSNDRELLFFYIQGDGLCAQLVLYVEKWNKLGELRKKKGVSFRNAEFKALKYDIQRDSLNIRFIYRDHDKIID